MSPDTEGGNASKSKDLGQDQAQEKVDAEEEKGYRGTVPDPTPNENYTVEGVAANKPTPETDEKAAAKADEAAKGA